MKRYEKYKDSKAEWIGEIPQHWEIKKLKYVITGKLQYGANESSEFEIETDPRYIRITDFGEDGKLRDDTFKSLPLEKAKEYFLKDGDILFARSGATVGKTFQFKNYKGTACYAGYLIKATPSELCILSDFLYFYTKSASYENWKNSIFNQATIQNIGADKYSGLEIPIPQLEEQITINRYLDKKISQLDQLITKKQQLIELLEEERTAIINQAVTKGINPNVKLKASGIEWLGDIPEKWKIKKLKYVAAINPNRPSKEIDKKSDDEVVFLPMEKVSEEGKIDQSQRKKISEVSSGFTYFERGDVIVAKITPCFENGKGALLENLETDFGYGSTEFHTLRAKQFISKQFLFYLTKSERFMTIGEAFMTGSAGQKRIPSSLVENFLIGLPTLEEQNAIVSYIKTKTVEISTTISKIEKEIELMKEYRSAIISEVVTGKIKVI